MMALILANALPTGLDPLSLADAAGTNYEMAVPVKSVPMFPCFPLVGSHIWSPERKCSSVFLLIDGLAAPFKSRSETVRYHRTSI